MQNEKIAAVALAIIIAGALSTYLYFNYKDSIFPEEEKDEPVKPKPGNETIQIGDCIDIHYIGRYASNDTIFSTSYSNPENKSGGIPLNVFVNDNISIDPPANYSEYLSSPLTAILSGSFEDYFYLTTSPIGTKNGFREEILALRKGVDNFITEPMAPLKAYGNSIGLNSVINVTELSPEPLIYRVIGIQEDAPMPDEIVEYYGELFGNTTTLFTLREDMYEIGDVIEEKFISWANSTVISKLNDTTMWMYTSPPFDIDEKFSWIDYDEETALQFTYPENSSQITQINESTIIITHTPEINSIIEEAIYYPLYDFFMNNQTYTVESLSDDKINVSFITDETTGNKSYTELNRKSIIQRNETRIITQETPGDLLEINLLLLRLMDENFYLSYHPLSDETVYFEIEILDIYKTSQEEI
jgi:hypothetical protein